jgi:hypothetical protein
VIFEAFLDWLDIIEDLSKDFLKISKPMNMLLKKDKKFMWTPACEASF